MKKELRLRKPQEFSHVYHYGKSWVSDLLVMKVLEINENRTSRFGFTVAKRTGNTVLRNSIKRRLRESVRHTKIKNGWDLVFIARQKAGLVSYRDLKDSVTDLLGKANLLTEPTDTMEKRANN